MRRAVLAFAADRVEVGDVELVEPQLGPERARERKRVAVVAGDDAVDRAIAFALAAHGVNRRAGLEIDDRYHAHAGATLAMDIGGANTKAAWLQGASLRTVSRPFEVWRDREALSGVLREVAAEVAGPADAVAITMTAELSDAFRTKREGVAFVLDAAEDALGDRPLSVLTDAGELVSVAAARARPWDVAAANWVATALAVADAHPDALLIDVGSTTADIVPIVAGRVAATGHNDLERLLAGELVYTGVLRTNLAAIAPRVPVRGGWCPVSSEYFAISADVHLVLGHLTRGGVRLPHARRPPGHRRVRARAHRPARVRRRRAARRGRDRRDRRLPRRPSSCARSRPRRAGCSVRCRPRHPSSRSAPAPCWHARSPRAWGERSPTPRAVGRDRRRGGARRGAGGAAGGRARPC